MSPHERFSFSSSAELLLRAKKLGVDLPFTEDLSGLFEKGTVASREVPNRLVVHPMEGFDSEPDGSPSDRVFRRYGRYAGGGSGVIWFEAASVAAEGKSNPHQMMLTENNPDRFKLLVEKTRNTARETFGSSHEVFCILQLTHSGRFSKPEARSTPHVAQYIPDLDEDVSQIKILSDRELDTLQEQFVHSAKLAFAAGFDAVDIKACHGYLVNDLLASFTRTDSHYGGSFANRTRFLLETIQKIKAEVPGLILAVRLSVFDGIPHPFGFGVSRDLTCVEDLEEPISLIGRLAENGCSLLNITLGNPHKKPYLGRPFDRHVPDSTVPAEHPLEGIGRLLRLTGRIQKVFPEAPCVGTGYSWLRQFFPHVGAAVVKRGEASFIGLGRSSFAYPEAPRDLMEKGFLNLKKVCVTCSCCTELTRAGLPTGCVIRDREVYSRDYKAYMRKWRAG
ncbi:MAG: hypothetical protein PVF22_00760 [Candidatus Aminicenantes bacterium]|jgi:2,4-dienoyl-CoA reductase-like NADH-dependent reductase (Old Yellow Enzyme family)